MTIRSDTAPPTKEEKTDRTVAVIGAGRMGAITAFATVLVRVADRVLLADRERERARAEALDLRQGLSLVRDVEIREADIDACARADVVVLALRDGRSSGADRIQRGRHKARLLREVLHRLEADPEDPPVLLVVPDPVDELTMTAVDVMGWPEDRVIGTGTVLETYHLRQSLADHFREDPHNVNAYVIGQRGSRKVIPWTLATVAGMPLYDFARTTDREWNDEIRDGIVCDMDEAMHEIVSVKDGLQFSMAVSTVRLIRAILGDERKVFTVSTVVEKGNGHMEAAVSLPTVISRRGRESAVPLVLTPAEREQFERSARSVRETYQSIHNGGE